MDKKTIGILGIGAIGSVISCHLKQKNNFRCVHYFNRSFKDEIKVQSPEELMQLKIISVNSVLKNPHLDWLICCLKTYQFKNATELLKQLVSDKTKVAIIRNGINQYQSVSPYTDRPQILECIIDCPTQRNEAGFYEIFKIPEISIPITEISTEFQALFNKKISIKQHSDFKSIVWKKLIESSGLGALMISINGTCGDLISQNLVATYRTFIEECIPVATKDGALIEDSFTEELIQKLYRYPREKGSSMLFDYRKSRQIEWAAKNGIIQEMADYYSIETPINQSLLNRLYI